jgi:hypothetical protein
MHMRVRVSRAPAHTLHACLSALACQSPSTQTHTWRTCPAAASATNACASACAPAPPRTFAPRIRPHHFTQAHLARVLRSCFCDARVRLRRQRWQGTTGLRRGREHTLVGPVC